MIQVGSNTTLDGDEDLQHLALNCDDSNPLYYPVGNCLYTTRVCSYAHFHLEELFISWMRDCIWTITLMVMRICGTLFCKLRWSWSSLMVYLPSSRIRCLKTSKFIIATIVAVVYSIHYLIAFRSAGSHPHTLANGVKRVEGAIDGRPPLHCTQKRE